MTHSAQRGFTLVELLVVITIIAMLVGLLVPAIGGARARARQAQCSNNQKEIALAVLGYESEHRRFPGYLNLINSGTGQYYAGWPILILPYLGRNDLWEAWRGDNDLGGDLTRVAVELGILTCPNDMTAQSGTGLSYAANCGRLDENHRSGSTPDFVYDDTVAHGVFHMHAESLIADTQRPVYVSLDDIASRDGATNTLLLSENINASQYARINNTAPKSKVLAEQELGFCWENPLGTSCSGTSPVRINECMDANGVPQLWTARPSSHHAGGVVVSYVDGHQDFLAEDIDVGVYRGLMAPHDVGAGL